MEPALAQFESAYKKKVNLVYINVDEKSTPEWKQYSKLVEHADGIPFTVWVDSKGKVIAEELGGMSQPELSKSTDQAMKKAR